MKDVGVVASFKHKLRRYPAIHALLKFVWRNWMPFVFVPLAFWLFFGLTDARNGKDVFVCLFYGTLASVLSVPWRYLKRIHLWRETPDGKFWTCATLVGIPVLFLTTYGMYRLLSTPGAVANVILVTIVAGYIDRAMGKK